MIPDEEIKTDLASRRPLSSSGLTSSALIFQRPTKSRAPALTTSPGQRRACRPLATPGNHAVHATPADQAELGDPLGSMGNDAALAVMSTKTRMLYDYFKQLLPR